MNNSFVLSDALVAAGFSVNEVRPQVINIVLSPIKGEDDEVKDYAIRLRINRILVSSENINDSSVLNGLKSKALRWKSLIEDLNKELAENHSIYNAEKVDEAEDKFHALFAKQFKDFGFEHVVLVQQELHEGDSIINPFTGEVVTNEDGEEITASQDWVKSWLWVG